jgi:hypothetical protein
MANDIESNTPEDLNPYYAKVIGYVSPNGEMTKTPAENQFKLLINAGEDHDVKVGERVLVFALGPEVQDPDTGESLGHFELVRGEGKVTSVQRRMAVIQSTRRKSEFRPKPISGLLAAAGMPRELETVTVDAEFVSPKLGDLVRFI